MQIYFSELADAWPPCMRVVVQETGLENLDVGSLFIVTCSGGTLGREGNHSVTIPDITISKVCTIKPDVCNIFKTSSKIISMVKYVVCLLRNK